MRGLNVDCVSCGDEAELYSGRRCQRCLLGATAQRLLTHPDTGVLAPQLQVIVDALAAMKRPNSNLTRIRQSHARAWADAATMCVAPSAKAKAYAASFSSSKTLSCNAAQREQHINPHSCPVTRQGGSADEVTAHQPKEKEIMGPKPKRRHRALRAPLHRGPQPADQGHRTRQRPQPQHREPSPPRDQRKLVVCYANR
jgi:hypothetical protein